ncbi:MULTISPECIES: Ldh family oxidoreductase [unclassified Roseitalea]|uniref:Ldh family oxidoreductase n=1 Tax=unclassified Roseitalea TaxID=2639107 RepID=UPI00273FCCBF|nr:MULTISPECIES: Ldh family oxidoreductase [unclassified Roseitalea]
MAEYPITPTDRRVAPDALQSTVTTIFLACGMGAEDASLLADSLVHADLRGVHSHGVIRIPDYVHKLIDGGVNPTARPQIVSRTAGAIVVDGNNSMGQIGASIAMDLAIETAQDNAIALAALRGSNHCGALDWYTLRAAKAGMIGMAGSNALPTMAPVGGRDKIVGMNPISIAVPGGAEPPLVLDLAFGATAHGKIRVYHQKGLPIPQGWAFDAAGEPTTDAAKALDGLIQPVGGHKGIALAMMIGIVSTLLSGASYGTGLGNMVDGPIAGRDGQFFIAIDIAAFRPLAEFASDVDAIVGQVHGSAPRNPQEPPLVPGEMERAFAEAYRVDGILLPAQTLEDIRLAGLRLGLSVADLSALS